MKSSNIYLIFLLLLIITLFSFINNNIIIKKQFVYHDNIEYCNTNDNLNVAIVIEPLYNTDLIMIQY